MRNDNNPHDHRHDGGYRHFDDREDGFSGGGFRTMPARPGDGGFHTLPAGPHGGPDFPHGGRRHGRGGMPPHGPGPDFLLERIDEAELPELLAMAGREMHRLPQGGPARGQNLILSILAGREALSQRELQQMLGVQPGSLSEILSKLERKGLMTREKAEDRRGNLLRITDEGRQAALNGTAEPSSDLFAALDSDQQESLGTMLRTLLRDWAARFSRGPRTPGEGRFVPLSDNGSDMQQI